MRHLGILCIVMLTVACSVDQASWPNTAFDSAQWRAAPEEKRYIFARDLIDRKLLLGKRESELMELLGPPTTVDQSGRQLSYVIKEGASGFDQVFSLDVVLNSSSRSVEEVAIRGD